MPLPCFKVLWIENSTHGVEYRTAAQVPTGVKLLDVRPTCPVHDLKLGTFVQQGAWGGMGSTGQRWMLDKFVFFFIWRAIEVSLFHRLLNRQLNQK